MKARWNKAKLAGVVQVAAALSAAVGSIGYASIAAADPVDEMRSEIESLQRRLADLEASKAKADAAPPAVTAGATKGSFKLPLSDTTVTLGGYVKLDALYSDRSAGVDSQGNQFYNPGLVPVGPAADNAKSQTTLHARQSRLFMKTATPTALGDLTTYVEGDFFGADGNETTSNSNGFRIRHAWGQLGHFGAGQFWTNFMNEAALPETLDFGGPAGQIFVRQAQVRWTQATGPIEWSGSLENPESLFGVTGNAAPVRADRDRYPDMVGRAKIATGFGTYTVQAMARDIRIDSGAPIAATDSRWGGAVGVSGVIPFGRDDVRFEVNAGNAIGRYQDLGVFADGMVDANHHVKLVPILSGYAAYRHFWAPTWRSSLVLSAARADNPSGTVGTLNREVASGHLNLIWQPTASFQTGGELILARREIEDGRSGDLRRIQFSAQYSF
jgi:DcaP outer membrane protein